MLNIINNNYVKNYECINYCRVCKNYLCRCSDCIELIENGGQWYCDKYGANCDDITICDEYREH